MKKVLCLLLCLLFSFSFVACKKDTKDTDSSSVDLEYYAKLGKIPECQFKLGDSVDELSEKLAEEAKKANEENTEYTYNVTEGEKSVEINNGTFLYYYEKEKKENGISYIVSFNGAYGMKVGDSVLDVKKTLAGNSYTEEAANDDNVFFLSGFANGSVIRCIIAGKVILFVFDENALTAVAIYDIGNWTL